MRRLLLALPFALLPLAVAQANEHNHAQANDHAEYGSSAADKAKVATVRSQLQDPQALFGLNAGDCTLSEQELESALFEEAAHDEQHADEDESEHSEIHAQYQLDCKKPSELKQLNLGELFKRFPATEKIQVQLIGPSGQQGVELTPANASLNF